MEMMKNDKKFKIKIVLLWVFAFIVIIFMMSIRSYAASDQDYFPMLQNKNGHFTDFDKQSIENYFDSENNYIFAYFGGYAPGYGTRMKNFYVYYFPKNGDQTFYGEKFNNLYQFSVYGTNISNNNARFFQILDQGWTYDYSSSLSYFQNLTSSNYSSDIDFVSNFQVYTNNNTDTRQIVLIYDDGVTVPEGDTAREDMEQPDIDNYIPDWTNTPSFDNSSVENALNSVFNAITWLGGNIKDTITGTGKFIGDTIRWSTQKVLDTIRGKIDEVKNTISTAIGNVISTINGTLTSIQSAFNNFKTGFENFADLFIHPFDEEEFEDQIENCQLISQYNELMDNCDDIRAIFNNAVERDYFVLYIDFENPFADSEHKIIHSQISFTWLKDYRSTYRPFLWLFTMIECFVGGMRLLGGIIGGKAK